MLQLYDICNITVLIICKQETLCENTTDWKVNESHMVKRHAKSVNGRAIHVKLRIYKLFSSFCPLAFSIRYRIYDLPNKWTF